MKTDLAQIKGFIFDMDGTLVLGDKNNKGLLPIPGAVEFTQKLKKDGIEFSVFTNGTTKTPTEYADVLAALGFPITSKNMLTPVSGALECFIAAGYKRVMVLGGKGIIEPLEAAGIEVVPNELGTKADAVLAGWYKEVKFSDFEAACDAVWAGASFFSCSQSIFFATANGRALGTSRAISAVVRDLTSCDVEVVGKPSKFAFQACLKSLGLEANQVSVVGDDVELEVTMANQQGALSIAVATGIEDINFLKNQNGFKLADYILSNVESLMMAWEEVRANA
jgi:4-nitrophenyl phosphatase